MMPQFNPHLLHPPFLFSSPFPPSDFIPATLLAFPLGHWCPSSGPWRGYSHYLECFFLTYLTQLSPATLFKFHLPSKTYPVLLFNWKTLLLCPYTA